jgi:hypothetical protein
VRGGPKVQSATRRAGTVAPRLRGVLDEGEELRTVMELLGHSTIRLTADTYRHVLPARAREATGAIDRLLGEGPVNPLAVPMAVLGPRSNNVLAGGDEGTRTP